MTNVGAFTIYDLILLFNVHLTSFLEDELFMTTMMTIDTGNQLDVPSFVFKHFFKQVTNN